MSSLTSSRPPSRSSYDYAGYGTQLQARNHGPILAQTPHHVASPGVPSTTLSAPTPPGSKHSTQHGTSSPAGYFGLVIEPGESTLSLNHTKHNWSPAASSIKSVAARSPRPVPLDNLPLSESFQKQAQALAFSLHHPNLSNVSEPGYTFSEFSGDKGSMVPSPPASYSPPSNGLYSSRDERAGSHTNSQSPHAVPQYFQNSPRVASPFSINVDSCSQPYNSLSYLSAPSSPFNAATMHSGTSARKSNTLPTLAKGEDVTMITPELLQRLLKSESNKVLLLDIRTYPQYAQSRIQDAVNLCIPTTLLKRPSFNVTKLSETFSSDADKEKFSRWKKSKYIVIYDANSQNVKEAVASGHTIDKFLREGWIGQAYALKGGFVAFASQYPDKVDETPVGGPSSPKSLSLTASGPKANRGAAGAFNCQLPLQTTVCNPFFSNIRQNMDLIGGVGEIPITLPQSMSNETKALLPRWLKQVALEKNGSKLVSERFLGIEKAEQERMQRALSCGISYDLQTEIIANRHTLAGVEQGTKNRYNNIWPYDHSRVKLKEFAQDSCDYINASHISSPHSRKRYIATQGPLPATFQDFWSVVWEQDVRVIVMLTAENEAGQVKCHNYWADERYGPLVLTKRSEERVALEQNLSKLNIKRRSTTGSSTTTPASDLNIPHIIVRRFSLCHDNYPFHPIREIFQIQYSSWPDFSAPPHPSYILALIEHTDAVLRQTRSQRVSNGSMSSLLSPGARPPVERPAIVHCSAGCGRTGTFCAVDTVIEMLKRKRFYQQYGRVSDSDGSEGDERDCNDTDTEWLARDDEDLICQVVSGFRDQRLSMVQSLRQFVLCYETVLEWFARQNPLESGKRKA